MPKRRKKDYGFITTSEAAERVGVHPNTLRWYESVGHLPPVPRTPGGYRRYDEVLVTQGTDFNLIAYFQQLRDLRHRDIYEGSIHVSQREAEDAVTEASRLLEYLRTWLEARADES